LIRQEHEIGGAFRRILGIETVFFSFSTADEDFHGPNEFFRLRSFRDGLTAWARALAALGERRSATRP
jgi:acetylornithine deacetylase/succinyl-diaminopimelate desuccinylase-like protein